MILPDVNVLLYAFRRDAERHDDYRSWLDTVVNGEAAYGISPQVLASVIRIATHRRIYVHPSTTPETLASRVGHRIGLRVGHDRSRLCPFSRSPLAGTVLRPVAEAGSTRCLGRCP